MKSCVGEYMSEEFEQRNKFGTCRARTASLFSLRSKDAASGWPTDQITWGLENTPRDASADECIDELENAFAVWENAGRLNISHTSDTANALIKVSFECPDDYPALYDENGLDSPAIAFYPDDPDDLRGRIIFNAKRDWHPSKLSYSPPRSILFCFAVHEMGHALGIDWHGIKDPDVMAKDPLFWNGILSADDIAAFEAVYPPINNGGGAYG